MRGWTIRDSLDLYNVANWGQGFFDINEQGRLRVQPRGPTGPGIDLLELVQDLKRRGQRTPLLIRFSDILAARVQGLAGAFDQAIRDYGYRGRPRGVYPIKVNQQRHVVEEIVQYGAAAGVGLDAGSKPELLIALAVLDTPGALIVCNGYKDRAYIETALLAQRLGRTPIIVIDRFHEIDLVVKTASELGIRPHLGVRARLTTKGAGKWVESTGDRSKFGLSALEIVEAVARLPPQDLLPPPPPAPPPPRGGGGPAPPRAPPPGDGGASEPARRGRRPRRGLRRLPDELPLLDELLGAGIRERRRGGDPGGVRRRGRAAPGHRHRGGPRHGGAPLGADLRRPRRERTPHERTLAARGRGRPQGAPGSLRGVQHGDAQERARGVARRAPAQGGGFEPVLAGLPRPARPGARGAPVLGLQREDPAHRARPGEGARGPRGPREGPRRRSEEHTSELQSRLH